MPQFWRNFLCFEARGDTGDRWFPTLGWLSISISHVVHSPYITGGYLVWELHAGGLAGHFGREKTINEVESLFYWPSLKQDVARLIGQCRTCQLAKQWNKTLACICLYPCQVALARHEYGFRAWTSKDYQKARFYICGCGSFFKDDPLLTMSKTSKAFKIAHIYFDGVVKLYNWPKTIMSGRDVKFMSYFWKTLWHKMGNKLKFFTVFHPQTDGQIEEVNRSLGNLLWCLISEHLWNWIPSYPLPNLHIIVHVIGQ